MTAVFRHEIRLLFSGLTAYVYGAFSLFAIAIYMMYYNLSIGYANFEYALAGASFAFLLIIPIITMRIIAEEKKQKTDQLLYSLPISTTQIVVGKFLAVFFASVYCDRISAHTAKLRKPLSSNSLWSAFWLYYACGSSACYWYFYFINYRITAHGCRNLFCCNGAELLYGYAGGICHLVSLWFSGSYPDHRVYPCASDQAYDGKQFHGTGNWRRCYGGDGCFVYL